MYRGLRAEEIDRELFRSFVRRQDVTKCLRRERGEWVIRDNSFIDDWNEADYAELIACLRGTLAGDGMVWGAFVNGALKGFASVEGKSFGGACQYMDLSCIHVSRDMRGHGIGRELFGRAKRYAKERNADRLYISAHSAVESQAFYRAMGCVEAREYSQAHVEKEPFDCQLECAL